MISIYHKLCYEGKYNKESLYCITKNLVMLSRNQCVIDTELGV